MKILTSRIKKWGFKQRLHEIRERLRDVNEHANDVKTPIDEIDECLQILDYWMNHMEGDVEKTKKKKVKPINVF